MDNVFFEIFSKEEREIIKKFAELRTYLPGKMVVKEGEKGDALYFVLEGRLEIVKWLKDKLVKQLRILQKGDMFGEIAFLGISVRSASVIAMEESELLELTKKRFDVLSEENPAVGLKLYRLMAENMAFRLSIANEEIKKAILAVLE